MASSKARRQMSAVVIADAPKRNGLQRVGSQVLAIETGFIPAV